MILGHAYTITKVVPEYGLIRIRNPWGCAEWTGAWSDRSTKWKKLTPEEISKYNLITEDDGEFYMSFKDFVQIFQNITICNISHLDAGLAWHEEKIFGSWRRNVSAGTQLKVFSQFEFPALCTHENPRHILTGFPQIAPR